jgi:hypothetical protein
MNDTNTQQLGGGSLDDINEKCLPTPLLKIDRTPSSLNLMSSSYQDDQHQYTSGRNSSPESAPSSPNSNGRITTLPHLYRLVRCSRLMIFLWIMFSIGSIAVMLDSFLHYQKDTSGCQTSYMRPQYIKQTGFDSEMTRFAGKYALYLYREKGVDSTDQVTKKNNYSFFFLYTFCSTIYLFIQLIIVIVTTKQ